MKSVISVYSVFRKLPFKGLNYLYRIIRQNHGKTKLNKLVFKPVSDYKEKEVLHQQLLTSLQKCRTVEEQIKVFYSLVKLPEESINERYAICKDLEKGLSPYFPSCSVHLIGSSANHIGFKGCDVDLSIQLPDQNIHKQSAIKDIPLIEEVTEVISSTSKVPASKNHLLTIRKILQNLKYDEPLTVIPGRCPILSFTARNLPCDLSVNNSSAFNSTNLMLLCGRLDERVIPVMQVILYWAKHSRLVGGISKFKTYGIFLMVLYFLQTRTPPVLPSVETMFEKTEFLQNLENWSYDVTVYLNKFEKSKNYQSIEQLLKEFFLFYGNFDFTYVICPINGTLMERKSFASHFDCIDKFELNTICIQDPLDLTWNVTTAVNWKFCKKFLKAIISVWENYQDEKLWIPGLHHWGLVQLINSEFSYNSLKDIKEVSIDLSFLTTAVNDQAQENMQKTADSLKHILSHCLLFQCHTFNQNAKNNLLDLPTRVKTCIESLFFKNNDVISVSNSSVDLNTNIVTQYICATQNTWSGRNTFMTFVSASKNIFDVEHEISKRMIAEKGINEKELFYFLCQCLSVTVNNQTHLHVRLKPLNSDRFIPKLAVFLKDYIPNLLSKLNQEHQDKN